VKLQWCWAAAGLAVALATTSDWSQSDPIAARMALMKGNNDNARNGIQAGRRGLR